MANEFAEMKKPIHFFKIILTQTLHQGNLIIPKMFVKKYGESLTEAICLKTPIGEDWKINLVKNDGKIWFEKGWKFFADHHSLSHGHLLVFKYESTSHFEVRIFDKSGLEINYPLGFREDCRASGKRKAYSSFEIRSTSCVNVGKSQKVAPDHHPHKKCKATHVNKTLERAREFKTSNPSFVLVMGKSYVEYRFLLTIPSKFAKTHFDLEKTRGYIYFKVLDHGLVWPAKYRIRNRMSSKGLKVELSSEWRDFVKDNNLKVGDVCNFELILSTNMTFLVHIFRETDKDNTNCSTSQKSYQIKDEYTQG